jgi:hypothetical protein
MTEIVLQPVTAANRAECENLRVAPRQCSFLPDNRSSIELAGHYPDACPMLARASDGTSVGFALYGIDADTDE